MADHVHRVTMFKIPSKENQVKLIEAYARDGKPYIRSLVVGIAEGDPRSQGYTVVCKTKFSSMEDMKFYDADCPAHGEFKATAKTLGIEGIVAVYFTPSLFEIPSI